MLTAEEMRTLAHIRELVEWRNIPASVVSELSRRLDGEMKCEALPLTDAEAQRAWLLDLVDRLLAKMNEAG